MITDIRSLIPKDDIPPLNTDQVEVLATLDEDNPVEMVQDLMGTYLGEWNRVKEELRSACETKNTKEMKRVNHFISGSSSNMGLLRVSILCRAIEAAVDDNQFDAYEGCLEAVIKENNRCIEAMNQYLGQLSSR